MGFIVENAYFFGVLIVVPIWLYFFLKNKDSRKEMLISGITFGVMSVVLAKYFCLLDYYKPSYLIDGFLLEDFLYGFFLGGLSSEIGQLVLGKKDKKVRKPKYSYFLIFLIITFLTIFLSIYVFKINSIYAITIPPFLIGIITVLVNKKFLKVSIVSALIVLIITLLVYNIVLLFYPDLFIQELYIEHITKASFLNVPLPEILFALALGFGASSYHELIFGFEYE